MSQKLQGNTRSLSPSLLKRAQRLYTRRLDETELVPLEFAREIYEVAHKLSRRVGVLISREGVIEEVIIGSRDILYLPDLGRYRLGAGRLRRLRLVFSDLSSGPAANLPTDIITDLEKLRFDAVVGVKSNANGNTAIAYAHLLPSGGSRKEVLADMSQLDMDFQQFISELEGELSATSLGKDGPLKNGAVLIHVSDKPLSQITTSLDELNELAKSAGVEILDRVIQKKKPDIKSVLGKGKLEETVLHCLRLGAEILIFDTELRPAQWRVITNLTELKIIDRSMLILDIFAARAQSADGALQVELAQLKYNLPRLVEKDVGLSRLSGGIGGRGPGETKLEIGRRRIRDRITDLEKRVQKVRGQRELRRKRREANETPLVAILGYTNVGKSTLFNLLTGSNVIAENKLFATLDPFQRQLVIPDEDGDLYRAIITDTVGFIRDLPAELKNAFRATLEELYSATIALHVIDASDKKVLTQMEAVKKILVEMDLDGLPIITVINKSDIASQEDVDSLQNLTDGIVISAVTGAGIDELLSAVRHALENAPAALSAAAPE